MESVADINHSDNDDFKPDTTSIDAVAAMGNAPQNQLSALRRLLGVNRLLHHTVSGTRTIIPRTDFSSSVYVPHVSAIQFPVV